MIRGYTVNLSFINRIDFPKLAFTNKDLVIDGYLVNLVFLGVNRCLLVSEIIGKE